MSSDAIPSSFSIDHGKGGARPKSNHARVAIPLPLSRPKKQSAPDVNKAGTSAASNAVQEHGKIEIQQPEVQLGAGSSIDETPTLLGQGSAATLPGTATPDSALSEQLATNNEDSAVSNNGSTNPSTPSQGDLTSRKPQHAGVAAHKPAPLRTELPPAFVPASAVTSPNTANSPWHSARSSQPASANLHDQHTKPSTNGVNHTATALAQPSQQFPPAPTPAETQSRSHNPPNRHSKHRSSITYHGHTHNFSESSAGYPPPHYQPAQQFWQPNGPQHVHPQPNIHHNYTNSNSSNRFPAYNPSSPIYHSNGQPFSPHADSSFTPYDSRLRSSSHRASFDTGPPLHAQPYLQQLPGSVTEPHMQNAGSGLLVAHHISNFLSSAQFSDISLRVHVIHDTDPAIRTAHRLVISQSTRLLSLIKPVPTSDTPSSPVDLHLPGRWASLQAFDDVLAWLYGRDLATDMRNDVTNHDHDHRVHRLRRVLATIAVSQHLQLEAAANRALTMVAPLLSWDTVLDALHFALDGGLHHSWSTIGRRESSDRPISHSPSAGPANDPAATQLLKQILHFLAHSFPPNFYSDASAEQLGFLPRLPSSRPASTTNESAAEVSVTSSVTHRATRSLNDPRLSRIRFGEVNEAPNANGTARPSPTTSVLSSILFSLPFPLLKFLLEHPALSERLGIETVGSIMRQVVAERESRRAKALETYPSLDSQHSHTQQELADNLSWEELVEMSAYGPLGIQLSRRKLGTKP